MNKFALNVLLICQQRCVNNLSCWYTSLVILMHITFGTLSHFRVMKALGSAGVPVPKTLALCEESR